MTDIALVYICKLSYTGALYKIFRLESKGEMSRQREGGKDSERQSEGETEREGDTDRGRRKARHNRDLREWFEACENYLLNTLSSTHLCMPNSENS